MDASRAFLTRRALASLADGAALDASHDIDLASLYTSGASPSLPLSSGSVRTEVVRYVAAQARANGISRVSVVSAVVGADGTVSVTVSLDEGVPLVAGLLGQRRPVIITATASAQTRVLPGVAP